MRTVDYDTKEKNNAGTETHLAVDDAIKEGHTPNVMEEGFAAADGVRGETAETGGRIKHPENGDDSKPGRVSTSVENGNPGLADN